MEFERERASDLSHCVDGGSTYWEREKGQGESETHTHTHTHTHRLRQRLEGGGTGEERRKKGSAMEMLLVEWTQALELGRSCFKK